MLKPFYNEETVAVGEDTYRLVIDFHAIDATETLLKGRSYTSVIAEVLSGDPPLGLMGRVLWGMLRTHHSDVSLEDTASLMFGETGVSFGVAIANLIQRAFSLEEPKAKDKNPRKRRGTSQTS